MSLRPSWLVATGLAAAEAAKQIVAAVSIIEDAFVELVLKLVDSILRFRSIACASVLGTYSLFLILVLLL